MGSFTSMPKVIPASNPDPGTEAEGVYPAPGARESLEAFLARCQRQLGGLPGPIRRDLSQVQHREDDERFLGGEKVKVLQWNVLSQGKDKDQYSAGRLELFQYGDPIWRERGASRLD